MSSNINCCQVQSWIERGFVTLRVILINFYLVSILLPYYFSANQNQLFYMKVKYRLLFVSSSTIHSMIWKDGGDTIAGKGLPNWDLWASMTFEQEGIFIVTCLLWQRTSIYTVSWEGPPLPLVASYNKPGKLRTYCNKHPLGTVLYAWETYTYCNRTGSSLSFSMDSPYDCR